MAAVQGAPYVSRPFEVAPRQFRGSYPDLRQNTNFGKYTCGFSETLGPWHRHAAVTACALAAVRCSRKYKPRRHGVAARAGKGGGASKLSEMPVVGLKGNPLKATLKIFCDLADTEYSVYWEKIGKGYVLAGEYVDPKYLQNHTMTDGSTFISACKLLEVGPTSIVAKCHISRDPIFVKNASGDDKFTRKDLAKKYGINTIYFFPFEKGVMEVGDAGFLEKPPEFPTLPCGEIKEAFEVHKCSSVALWTKSGNEYKTGGYYITSERAAVLEKRRGDRKSFASESARFKLSEKSIVGRVAATGQPAVMKNAAMDKTFTRRDVAREFNLTKIRIVPCAAGALEYGVPRDEAFKGNTLGALLKMRCDSVGANYALYWAASDGEEGDEFAISGYYSPASSGAKGTSGDKFATASTKYKLDAKSLVGHVFSNEAASFIANAQQCKVFTRKDMAIECGIQSICMEFVKGGVVEYGTSTKWANPPASISLPENELHEAFEKLGATYALLWVPEGDDAWKVTTHFTSEERRAALKAVRGDDRTFAAASAETSIPSDSLVGNVARTKMRDAVYDAGNDHQFTRKGMAKEFGVTTIRFVPTEGGVLEYGTPLAKKVNKKEKEKGKGGKAAAQKSGRGRRMQLEQQKKAALTNSRGFLTPIVDIAKSFMGEDGVIELRQEMIQAHVREINGLTLDADGVRAAFDHCDTDGDGKITLSELDAAIKSIGFVHLKDENVAKMLKKADINKDKMINFEEFKLRVHPVLRRNFAKLASFRGKQLGLLS